MLLTIHTHCNCVADVLAAQDWALCACSDWFHYLIMFSCLQKAIIGEGNPSILIVTITVIGLRSLSLFCFDT